MKVSIILGHPDEHSFNHAVAARVFSVLVAAGHNVYFHDIYREGFDPVMTDKEMRRGVSFDNMVIEHTEHLLVSDGLVIVHPDWWGQPPAILKGWIDRVLRPGVAYEFHGEEFLEKTKIPLLEGKRGLVLITTDSISHSHEDFLKRLWRENVLGYCGITDAHCFVLNNFRNLRRKDKRKWLERVEGIVKDSFLGARAAVSHLPD